MAGTDRDAVPPGLAEELDRRISKMRPELPRIVFDNTEVLIWASFYSDGLLELGDLGFTLR